MKLTSGEMAALRIALKIASEVAEKDRSLHHPIGTWSYLLEQLRKFVRGDPWEKRYFLTKEVEADESRESL